MFGGRWAVERSLHEYMGETLNAYKKVNVLKTDHLAV